MVKDKYHHGDLKKDLIKKGLQLLNKEGYEDFSLRKVAALCGVSHAAPYKHFRSKEELISAIMADVAESFTAVLAEVMQAHFDDPKARVVAMGKQYAGFMVENPDYFRFIFLTDHHHPIVMTADTFELRENHPFGMIRKCTADYFASVDMDEKDWARETLALWSLVHGFTALVVYNTIAYSGDYLELVSRMLEEKL